MKDKTVIIITLTIATIIIFLLYLFITPEGVEIVHEHTNIICNMQYDDELQGWRFEANSTDINSFIKECKSRGVGR